jgi:hypothetical protein
MDATRRRSPGRFRSPPLSPTGHQVLEYLVAAVLAYTATHYPNGSAVALLALAAVIAALAAISPGHLAVRPLLGHRARRIADVVVAVAAATVVLTVTTTDLLPSVVLGGSALTLVRLALSSVPSTSTATDRHVARELQPAVNRAARAAGGLVRAWRSSKTR